VKRLAAIALLTVLACDFDGAYEAWCESDPACSGTGGTAGEGGAGGGSAGAAGTEGTAGMGGIAGGGGAVLAD